MLMLWFYVFALLFVTGAELNAELLKMKAQKSRRDLARSSRYVRGRFSGVSLAATFLKGSSVTICDPFPLSGC